MKKITIYDYKRGKDEHHTLTAEINEKGDLVLSGYDCGEYLKDLYGDFDYEYWLTIKAEDVSTILLNLIKEQFKSDVEFKEWLEKNDIPYDTISF